MPLPLLILSDEQSILPLPLIRSVPRQGIPISISITSCHTMEFGDRRGKGGGLKTAKRGAA